MSSLEYLIQLYPNKTGKELLEIQKEMKQKLIDEENRKYQKSIDFANEVNKAGAYYYKGTFGLEQRFFYKISNLQFDKYNDKHTYMDVEHIYVYLGTPNGVVPEGEFKIEKKDKTCVDLDKYNLKMYERIDEKEWNELNNYAQNIKKFWEK